MKTINRSIVIREVLSIFVVLFLVGAACAAKDPRTQENIAEHPLPLQVAPTPTPIPGQYPAILTTSGASNKAVIFPNAYVPGTQNLVSGLPSDAAPQGVSYYGSDNALISDQNNPRVFVVQISTGSLLSTINTSPNYDGTGTLAVAPSLAAALAMAQTNQLNVIHAPFGSASPISHLTLPGVIQAWQTQAIVFNNAGRAFVYHTTGISVLDAPYNSIAFTIPVAGNSLSGAIAISPNGNTLLTTTNSSQVKIFQGPFSAASTSTSLTIPGANQLDGIMIAPNGASAIVVSVFSRHAASIAAPFSSSSTVQTIPLPASGDTVGFEDVGISADSQIAMLTGQGESSINLLVYVRAPFGATSVTSLVPIAGVANPGRGSGAIRFMPPGLAPGLTISKSAPATVVSGTNLTYTISYSNTGAANATNVIIRDPLPAGTTFVSATGGMLIGGNIVYNIGPLNAGAGLQTVSFTVTVNTAGGGTVDNNNYTIEGDGVFPIPGPPITTAVTARIPTPTPTPTPSPGRLANVSTRLRVETDDNVLIGGFIIVTGTQPKKVLLRAIGPSLTGAGVQGALADPTLELHDSFGLVASNDNWVDAPNRQEIFDSTLAPADNLESAILTTLPANNSQYTAIVRGVNNSTGVALVEAYDLDLAANSTLANISTRGLVQTGDNVMIGGFIVVGQTSTRVIVRAIGPSLSVPGKLADPTLELHDGNGALLQSNDNWRTGGQEAEIIATTIPPSNDLESAIVRTLAPGNYTAIVRGVGDTSGIAVVEAYQLNN